MTDAAVATPQPGAAPPPAASSGALTHDAFSRLSVEEQGAYSQVRRQDGNGSEWVLRSSLPGDDAPSPKPGDKPADAPIDPKAMQPGQTVTVRGADGKDFVLTSDDIAALMTQRAENDLRRLNMPADANGYEVKLPESLKLPVELKIDANDPAFTDLKAWAHKRGLTQGDFSDVLGIYAQRVARDAQAFNTARAGEVAKLGTNAAARIDAVSRFVKGMVGDDLGNALLAGMATERSVRAFEKLMTKVASQGHAPFSAAHRDPGPPDKVTDEEYSRMSPGEKFDYARQHSGAR